MTLLAPTRLLLPAGDCKRARRLVLASREWLDLQARIESLLGLPATVDDMQAVYGHAAAVTQSRDAFGAIEALRHTAGGYGSTQRLRARLLDAPQHPDTQNRPGSEAFGCALWAIQRAGHDARALSAAFTAMARQELPRPANDTVASIKSRFLDQGQLVAGMECTVTHLNTAIARFQALDLDMDGALQKARAHTAANSRTRKWLDAEIGTLSAALVQWEQQRSDACSRWLDLALAAGTVPAPLGFVGASPAVILSAPQQPRCFTTVPAEIDGVATIAAGALAAASGCARATYNRLLEESDGTDDFVAQCVHYRADIGALEQVAQHWHGASGGVIAQLRAVRDAWSASAREFVAHVGALDTSNLADGPWLKPGPMEDAAQAWQAIADAAGSFVHGAVIEARPVEPGGLLPRDAPRWQSRFAARATA